MPVQKTVPTLRQGNLLWQFLFSVTDSSHSLTVNSDIDVFALRAKEQDFGGCSHYASSLFPLDEIIGAVIGDAYFQPSPWLTMIHR